MSADVWLEIDTGAEEATEIEGTHRNLTYNLTPMLRAAGFPGWRELVGMDASAAGPMLRHVVATLESDPPRYEAMNPPNGWGTYEDAVEVLDAMADDCNRHPKAKYGGSL